MSDIRTLLGEAENLAIAVEAAKGGVESAKARVEEAKAALDAAKLGVDEAKTAVDAARTDLEDGYGRLDEAGLPKAKARRAVEDRLKVLFDMGILVPAVPAAAGAETAPKAARKPRQSRKDEGAEGDQDGAASAAGTVALEGPINEDGTPALDTPVAAGADIITLGEIRDVEAARQAILLAEEGDLEIEFHGGVPGDAPGTADLAESYEPAAGGILELAEGHAVTVNAPTATEVEAAEAEASVAGEAAVLELAEGHTLTVEAPTATEVAAAEATAASEADVDASEDETEEGFGEDDAAYESLTTVDGDGDGLGGGAVDLPAGGLFDDDSTDVEETADEAEADEAAEEPAAEAETPTAAPAVEAVAAAAPEVPAAPKPATGFRRPSFLPTKS